MTKNRKYVYFFGGRKADGNAKMKDLLGGKGANLAEMVNCGIPVPPGFTISTEACKFFNQHRGQLPLNLKQQVYQGIKKIEKETNKIFGDFKNPLLLSIRSGSKYSMPGMMDTILNLGLNNKTIIGLAQQTNTRFAYDSYRRFIQMFGNVVLGIDKQEFEEILSEIKINLGIKFDLDLREEDLLELIKKYKNLVKRRTKEDLPQDVWRQLLMARDAVFKSWNNPRAQTYRQLNKIPDNLGTAVNIQAMVFGNLNNNSATGVGFTRNPSTGKNEFYGEYLINAQGEDVVAGVRTPQNINQLAKEMPKAFRRLRTITKKLEKHYRDIQDFEFTIENNRLYILQTRTGKRTARAAVKIAVDMVEERLINLNEAIMRVEPEQINQLLHPIIDPKIKKLNIIARGLPASPGAAVGKIVFDSEQAVLRGQKEPIILVRTETCPDDIHGMDVAQGILTARGGMTSHAAVVARGMGRCCISGCDDIKIDEKNKKMTIKNLTLKEGDWLTLDGNLGHVILGQVATIQPTLSGEFKQFMNWTDKIKRLAVRANADIPRDAKTARDFGAEGIGLCRTEHMFFAEERLPIMQQMILADDEIIRKKVLQKLLSFQKEDFKGLFREMRGYPVTIRTLDPPLHEFLPKNEQEARELSRKIKISVKRILNKTQELHEQNPMLGHRGCRLGISYPEITEMQTRAIISAACELKKKEKINVVPEIMIPLVGHINELKNQKDVVIKTAQETMKSYRIKINYLIGTMIEVPRAALTANEIAEEADFFSFGTNDLTQMGMGFSRDDAGKFIKIYLEKKIFITDPFQSLDQQGIGQLINMGINKGRSVKKNLKIGICGEHGGDPVSIKFCHRANMNYVSCSPYRVPIARLAAAQAVIEEKLKIEYTSK